MSIIDGIKLPSGDTYNITIPLLSSGFTTTAGSSTSGSYLATKWAVANVNGITTPVDGMTIAVRVPLAGNSGGILLSIDGGTTYYPIVRNVNTLVTTNYGVGATVILTFNSTQTAAPYTTAGTTATVTGCWQVADYDSNSYAYVRQYVTTTNANYPLLCKYDAGTSTTTNYVTKYTRYGNNMYANPSTGTITATKFNGTGLTASTALVTDSSKNIVSSAVTSTELGYLSGVTSAIQTQLNGKAASSHGNHVPTTETANNAKFLRNDNTWQTVTPANIGAAASSHTHNYAGSSSAGGAANSAVSDTPITTAGTGSAYTATVAGITALTAGVSFIMVPNVVSASTTPTLNVNSLGAKTLKRRLSNLVTGVQSGYTTTWLAAGKPFRVTYDGSYWIVEGMEKPVSADLYGAVAVDKGGTGATTAAAALTNLGITYGTDDLTAGTSALTTGAIYFVYE